MDNFTLASLVFWLPGQGHSKSAILAIDCYIELNFAGSVVPSERPNSPEERGLRIWISVHHIMNHSHFAML